MSDTIRADAVIIGGGIAGLWTLDELTRKGYSAVLLERDALGSGQTIASQGIIHGGVKYRLPGASMDASKSVAEAHAIWVECLDGRASPNLGDAGVLSRTTALWTMGDRGSNMVAGAASLAMRSHVRPVDRAEAGAGAVVLMQSPERVSLYEVDEPVIDTSGVLGVLARAHRDRVIAIQPEPSVRFDAEPDGLIGVRCQSNGAICFEARWLVLCAGAGNAELLTALGRDPDRLMQRRPLHMVMVADAPADLYGHCLGLSSTPRVTITTGHHDGRRFWYVGGALAESGVARSEREQIAAARDELSRCLAWVDLSGCHWATLRIDRAEGRARDRTRPDGPSVTRDGNVLTVWPTKMVLAPVAAAMVAEQIARVQPDPVEPASAIPPDLPRPVVARPPWAREGIQWT